MKFKGRKVSADFQEIVVIGRPDIEYPKMEDGKPVLDEDGTPVIETENGDMVFVVKPVRDYEVFEAMCPPPKGQEKIGKNGQKFEDVESPEYKTAFTAWLETRTAWMILQSIRDTPDIEFEIVKMTEPATWLRLEDELEESGILPMERLRLIGAVLNVNGLNQDKIEKARASFLAKQVASDPA